jgi:hypothetical protein
MGCVGKWVFEIISFISTYLLWFSDDKGKKLKKTNFCTFFSLAEKSSFTFLSPLAAKKSNKKNSHLRGKIFNFEDKKVKKEEKIFIFLIQN